MQTHCCIADRGAVIDLPVCVWQHGSMAVVQNSTLVVCDSVGFVTSRQTTKPLGKASCKASCKRPANVLQRKKGQSKREKEKDGTGGTLRKQQDLYPIRGRRRAAVRMPGCYETDGWPSWWGMEWDGVGWSRSLSGCKRKCRWVVVIRFWLVASGFWLLAFGFWPWLWLLALAFLTVLFRIVA